MTYRLRSAARWHDGKPVLPEDVVFSFDALKKNSPMYSAYYQHIVKCEQVGERDVKFTFDAPGNRELPMIAGEVYVLPKHWWEGTDAQGNKRDITATTLEVPLASGPYRIKEFVAARSVVLERVADYWGKDRPTSVGQNNFDQMRFEYFRDDTVAREAFKGDQLDWFGERSGKEWSTAYNFPAVTEKRVIKEKFPDASSGRMQGFAMNLRRPLFADVKVRRAFNYAYDWEEWTGSSRMASTIATAATSTASPNSWRPVFRKGRSCRSWRRSATRCRRSCSRRLTRIRLAAARSIARNNLREAARLLKEAGFEIRDRKLVDPKGQPVSVEFLSQDPGDERGMLFYKPYARAARHDCQ